ncbi:MAG: hypothetical protein AAGD25_19670 [Cyanobacteria bacterium P01_F01_bin.150]
MPVRTPGSWRDRPSLPSASDPNPIPLAAFCLLPLFPPSAFCYSANRAFNPITQR